MEFTGLTMLLNILKHCLDRTMQQSIKDSQCQLNDNSLQGSSEVLQKSVYALNQHLVRGAISLIPRIHGSKNQEVEMGVASLTITPSDLSAKFLLPVLCSDGLEILVPKEGTLPSGNTIMMPLNWELRMPLGHSGLLTPKNQQAKKGCAGWAV